MSEDNNGQVVRIEAHHPHDTPPRYPSEPEIERPGYAVHDDWFTVSGKRRQPGLYWHERGQGEDSDPVDTWIARPIHAVARTDDENGCSAGRLLRFLDDSGRWREWAMPKRLLGGDGTRIREELLDMGFDINYRHRARFLEWLSAQHPRDRIMAASRTGWHDVESGRCFVLPGRTIGAENVRHQTESPGIDDFRQAGTLQGWRETVAAPCRGNPVLILAVSAALAGPLLKVAAQRDAGGHGFHLVGDSSKGKTTALQAAASVWGGPGFVRTWRATGNGLEATAAALNDAAIILDEISEANPHEIGGVVYALANGHGKQRARREGGSRQAARWRVVALSSGERTLAGHMGEAGGRVKSGQSARLLDVPATWQSHGAFDELHGHPDGRAFADALKQASERHHGHAGPAFVEWLIDQDHDLPERLARTQAHEWFQEPGELAGRAGSAFALVATAGELATEAGITGWQTGEALEAAAFALGGWADLRGGGHGEDQQILNAVRDFLDRHGDARFSSLDTSGSGIRDRAGYWRDTENGRVWYFTAGALREAASGFETRRIADALEAAGWLAAVDPGKRSKRIKVEGRTAALYAIDPEGGDDDA